MLRTRGCPVEHFWLSDINAYPHPGPLPRGEGESSPAFCRSTACDQCNRQELERTLCISERAICISLSPGERAGVRVRVFTNKSRPVETIKGRDSALRCPR